MNREGKLNIIKPIDNSQAHESLERVKDITFNSEGQKLFGKIYYPKLLNDKNPAVLFIHGWKGGQKNKFEAMTKFTDDGYVCMTFNLRGHGESEGDIQKLTIENFTNDAVNAYDKFVEEKCVDPKNISVIGSSLGSFLTASLAKQRNLKNIILRSPINYPNDDLNIPVVELTDGEKFNELVEWRQKALDPESSISLESVHKFEGNILLVESEFDQYVPHQTVENYIDAVKKPSQITHKTITGAKHRLDDEQKIEYQNIVLNWLKTNTLDK